MLLISLSLEGSDAIPVSHGNLQSRPPVTLERVGLGAGD